MIRVLLYSILFLFFLLPVTPLQAQLTQKIGAYSSKYHLSDHIEIVSLPKKNMPSALKASEFKNQRYKTLQFAHAFDTLITPETHGVWESIPDGTIWRLGIYSEGAYSLNFIFNSFYFHEGVLMHIYNEDKTDVIGAITSSNNKSFRMLSTAPVSGDLVFIELFVPRYLSSYGELQLSRVGHDFADIKKILKTKDGNFGRSGACNIDVGCYINSDAKITKNSVCRIIFSGNELCSGVLMNNTAQNGKPYLLTANHCISNASLASTALFLFSYESPYCKGPDGNSDYSISGSVLKATTYDIDFTLLELSEQPLQSQNPVYMGWNAKDSVLTKGFSIHHPWGDVKKLSADFDSIQSGSFDYNYLPNSHFYIQQWDLGVTEPGSSGSPLFDTNHRVVGTLTGGDATCSFPYNDYYQMIRYAWDYYPQSNKQLKYWLDPLQTDTMVFNAYAPFKKGTAKYDTNFNFTSKELLISPIIENGVGYWTGHNNLNFKQYAEQFQTDKAIGIVGIIIDIAKLYNFSDDSVFSIQIWNGDERPGFLLFSKDFSYLSIALSEKLNFNHPGELYLPFDSTIFLKGSYFIGYKIGYNTPDTLALKFQDEKASTSFVFDGNSWEDLSLISGNLISGSLGLSAISFDTVTDLGDIYKQKHPFSVFPNPVKRDAFIHFIEPVQSEVTVSVYDLAGTKIFSNNYTDVHKLLIVKDFYQASGIYLLQVSWSGQSIVKKIITK